MTRGVTLVLLTSFIVFLHSVKTVTVDTVHWTLDMVTLAPQLQGLKLKDEKNEQGKRKEI